MRNNRIVLVSVVSIFIVVVLMLFYYSFIQKSKEEFSQSNYKKIAEKQQVNLQNMIDAKRKATLGLAITLAEHDTRLAEYVKRGTIPASYCDNLIHSYTKNTLYKHIWIQVLDAEGISLYRSWSALKGCDLSKIRQDIHQAIETKKPLISISTGQFDITLKSIAPIFQGDHFLGLVEVSSHFNSITEILRKDGIESVVVADTYFKKQLKYSLGKSFINGYYVSNLTVKKKFVEYLRKHTIKNYYNNSYKVENGYLITSHLLKSNKQIIGAFIMFEKLSNIDLKRLDKFMWHWLLFGLSVLFIIIIIANIGLYFITTKQKRYYKNILDSSNNIVLTNNGVRLTDANKTFFTYFNGYQSLEDFHQKESCIGDFFLQEEGYIQKEMDGVYWVEYLLEHQEQNNKVKIGIEGVEYYFLVSASMISKRSVQMAIVLADITEQELYRYQLEEQTVTDPMTGIKNRRFYETKMHAEILRADRYAQPLSIIMLDIDHFKNVNDKYGHDAGDKVLIEYTKLIKSIVRDTDIFCRVGGEEFVIITPNTTASNAYKLAEKIRQAVEESKVVIPITMSFGVTQHKDAENKDTLFKRVDEALYEAKESGRNRVVNRP